MHPDTADVAGAAQACAPGPARDRPFDPGAARIVRLKRVCRFTLPGCLSGVIWPLGPDGERPPWVALLSAHTWRELGAAPAVLG
jgi:hypothetical protein